MEAWEDDADAEGEEGLRDFAYGGKDALIFLVDASKPMREKSKEEQVGYYKSRCKSRC